MRVTLERRQLWLTIILGVIGAAAWWYLSTQSIDSRSGLSDVNQPDYTVDMIQAVVMDANGQPQRRLKTDQLRHYAVDGRSELDNPIVWLRRNAIEPPWQVTAAVGKINADGTQTHLGGGVVAERAATADTPALSIKTSAIVIFTDIQYAETRHFVALDSGDNRMTAERGMQVWFGDEQRAKLFGRVRTQLVISDVPARKRTQPLKKSIR
ncbi:LPS export ABC transporter periplasmic protein LptC [Rhodoferax sp. 4810]|uniref:LPS export ABC transporter periplasmic protein LptC n=1 Tax=Thiospirillum jenense TaxID=1653858 RepID=A0A839HF70_9GAMM|nr:LPS export ABC transporter periplasmic protein LptC [Thiospirillum jenense]MBB1073548.1 LPS export ABC transporter periplasmic protein LptC [Rhodoferax jenense]MBB1126036.1 LPS export ABC transporter periplasmic protein LptC [Thiospirillum jenense]